MSFILSTLIVKSTGNNYTACTKEIEVHIYSEIQVNEVGNCGENG